MPTLFGAVPVKRVRHLTSAKGDELYGQWLGGERVVRLDQAMDAVRAWQTYWHEWAHAVLDDAGVRVRTALAERVCDAVANARMREMLDAPQHRGRRG